MSLDFAFIYFRYPEITLEIGARADSVHVPATALLDTGSDLTLFEISIAQGLGLDLTDSPSIRISGLGNESREAKLAIVHLELMGQSRLSALLEVGFAPEVEILTGNILGLDALRFFDLALSHSKRIGYIGITDP